MSSHGISLIEGRLVQGMEDSEVILVVLCV